jgi:hypothetical protein
MPEKEKEKEKKPWWYIGGGTELQIRKINDDRSRANGNRGG